MANVEAMVEDLTNRGYVEVQEFGSLKVGTRVRGVGEQYFEATHNGTGSIERIFHKPNSHWAQKYGQPDVEVIMSRDKPRFGPDDTHSLYASYGVVPVDPDRFSL